MVAEAREVVQGTGGKEVVPSTYIESRYADPVVMRQDAEAFPIFVAIGTLEPIVEIRRELFAT